MTLLQLQYALECASTGSIGKAAENVYTTASNLSKMLKALEDELGFALFIRSSNGIVPTRNGEQFFRHAQNIMGELEEISTMSEEDLPHKLFVACQSNPYCCAAFAELVNLADSKGESMNYVLHVCSDIESIELLKTGQCDLAVLEMPVDYENRFLDQLALQGLHPERITKMQVHVIINREHPALTGWTLDDPFDFTKLRDYPCVGYPKRGFFELSYHPRVSRQLPNMVDPNKYVEVNNYPWRDTIISKTNAFSVGFFAPQSLLESKHLIGIPVPNSFGHLFGLTMLQKSPNPLVKLFLDYIKKSLEEPKILTVPPIT